MRLIVQHSRNITGNLTQSIILHDDECDTGRSQILLCTTIDTDIFGHVDGTRENIRRHIGHHRNVYVQIFLQFRTVDCIVGSNMEIVCISRHSIVLRDIGISRFSGRSDFNYFTECLSFFHGFFGPHTRIQVSSFLFKEVEGYHAEFQTGTTAQEQYRISFGNIEQFFE